MKLEPVWEPSNRVKSRIAKKQKFWCSKCDACLVGQLGKCSNCGFIEHKNKSKHG